MRAFILPSALLLAVVPETPVQPRHASAEFSAQFPRDHGAHLGFRTEWWYVTGHLWGRDGRRFGFELTFFRFEVPPKVGASWRGSRAWRTDEVHLAHAALSDLREGRFAYEERLQRGGVMAGAMEGDLDVFNGDWSLRRGRNDHFRLVGTVQGRRIELELSSRTPPVRFGEGGYLRKGDDPKTGSLYFTYPRLHASGTLAEGSEQLPVEGQAWMDHEFSSQQLAPDVVGWDWAGVQLKDGRSLMVYQLRRHDGSASPWSLLTEIDAKGKVRRTTREFTMVGTDIWTSPRGGTRYPLPIRLEAWGESWTFVPLLFGQEMKTRRATYWEGACTVNAPDGSLVGDAYVELTGYAHSLQGKM